MSDDNGVGTVQFALVNLLVVVLGAVAGGLLLEAYPLVDDADSNQFIGISLGVFAAVIIAGRIRARRNRH